MRQLLYLGEIDEDRQNACLNAIDVRIGRRPELDKDGNPVEREHKSLSRDELVSRLAVAKSKADPAVLSSPSNFTFTFPSANPPRRFALTAAGRH